MLIRKHVLLFAVGVLCFSACTKSPTAGVAPERVLENYVDLALNAKDIKDKEKLAELSTGEARAALEKMSNEEFKKEFIDNKLQKQGKLKTKDLRQEEGGDVSLVYELSYQDTANAANQAQITVKKIAYLGKDEKGNWKIKATKNVKSLIERKEPLEVVSPAATPPIK